MVRTTNLRIRISAALLCACLVCVCAFSMAFIVKHSHHDCAYEQCRTCAQIERAQNLLKQLRSNPVSALSSLVVFAGILIVIALVAFGVDTYTPVALKVRINN